MSSTLTKDDDPTTTIRTDDDTETSLDICICANSTLSPDEVARKLAALLHDVTWCDCYLINVTMPGEDEPLPYLGPYRTAKVERDDSDIWVMTIHHRDGSREAGGVAEEFFDRQSGTAGHTRARATSE